jgi:hypothetical protein
MLVNQANAGVILSVGQDVHTDIQSNQHSNDDDQGACNMAELAVMARSAQI